jgi:cell wall-associated NlpC family hydrolase
VTWDQVNYGSRVSREELQPGDLVFFYEDISYVYEDISYVGPYIDDGMMIHAPNPSTVVVKYESIDVMPIYGYVRPA